MGTPEVSSLGFGGSKPGSTLILMLGSRGLPPEPSLGTWLPLGPPLEEPCGKIDSFSQEMLSKNFEPLFEISQVF